MFGPGLGITYGQLAAAIDRGQTLAGVPFVLGVRTIAGIANYDVFDANNAPFPFIIIWARGHMVGGAAGAGDTVVLQRIAGGVTTAISDTVDLGAAALADTDTWDFAQLNDAQWLLGTGDRLRVVTASDALCEVWMLCMRSLVAA